MISAKIKKHTFYFSKTQAELQEMFGEKTKTFVDGIEYTEWRTDNVLSSFSDAKIVAEYVSHLFSITHT